MNLEFTRAIHLANKHVRKKSYQCLVPGCNKFAIRGHSVPRSSLIEAIARNGKLFSLSQSYPAQANRKSLDAPMVIAEVGVNEAGVFYGFCQQHDTKLFLPAEIANEKKRDGIMRSLHLRAITLEFCRKRRNLDFLAKLLEFNLPPKLITAVEGDLKLNQSAVSYFASCIDFVFSSTTAERFLGIDYFALPISKNFGVSCCGVFSEREGDPITLIGFNLISYREFSILILTAFENRHAALDMYVSKFKGVDAFELLMNEVAFLKDEEPLISPALWDSLSENQRHEVGLCLVHPAYRSPHLKPRFVQVSQEHFLTEAPPALVARLGDIAVNFVKFVK